MPKVNLRNKVGVIGHAVSKIVLGNHTAKNVYGNVNYAKTFIQGTIMNVFNGHVPGRKNAIWTLTIDFEMPSNKTALGVELKRVPFHQQHPTFGPVPAGKKTQCFVNFTDLIGKPNHAMKGSTTYLFITKDRASPASLIAAASAAPHVFLLPASHIAESAGNRIKVIIVPPALPPMVHLPSARRKKMRKKATALAAPAAAIGNALTATPMLSAAPATKKSKTTSKKKATKPINLHVNLMWAKMTDGVSHCVVAIAHGQKWVVGNAATINSDITNEP
jgi:hypothetical protein